MTTKSLASSVEPDIPAEEKSGLKRRVVMIGTVRFLGLPVKGAELKACQISASGLVAGTVLMKHSCPRESNAG